MRRPAAPRKKQSGLAENVKTIVYAGLIALLFRSLLFEPFNIPSGSMIPTLLVGDFVMVSKYSYGYSRFSFPFAPDLFSGRIFGALPHRGDVAVFRQPTHPSIDFIKRIVGLPGDRIQMQHGHLFINGTEAPRVESGTYLVTSEEEPSTLYKRYIETLPPGAGGHPVRHAILKAGDDGPLDSTQVYVVPPGHVFAMGDNRDDSLDSRVLDDVGYIPVENLIGHAQIIFFSFDLRHPWWEAWYWPLEIRWGRLLTVLH